MSFDSKLYDTIDSVKLRCDSFINKNFKGSAVSKEELESIDEKIKEYMSQISDKIVEERQDGSSDKLSNLSFGFI